jgi:hypothetical protein
LEVVLALRTQTTVRALCHDNIPGLAITDAQGHAAKDGRWVITHVASGRCIPYVFADLHDASRALLFIGPLEQWTKSAVELLTKEELHKTVETICLAEHGAPTPATI